MRLLIILCLLCINVSANQAKIQYYVKCQHAAQQYESIAKSIIQLERLYKAGLISYEAKLKTQNSFKNNLKFKQIESVVKKCYVDSMYL